MFGGNKFSFGSTTTSGGLFGQSTTNTNQPAQASTGGFFGAKPATTLNTSATTSTSGFGGFGQANKSIFGQPSATTTATSAPSTQLNSTFGGFGQKPATTGTAFSFGGQQTTQSNSLLGQSLLSQPQQTTATPFGSTSTFNLQGSTSLLNNTTTQSGLTTTTTTGNLPLDDQFTIALINPQAFNDERDAILSKWNQLQSFYGSGKVFYQNTAIDVNKDNKYTRFKTIGYSCKPSNKEEDGLVSLIINQKEDFVKTNKKNITDTLLKIFNNDQSLIINIASIKPSSDDKTEVVFYIEQKLSTLTQETKRVSSVMVFNHLNKQEQPATTGSLLGGFGGSRAPTVKQHLDSINVTNMYPMVGLTDEQIKQYLENTPVGINPSLWDQAKKNNPNPTKLMPVPITGFQEISKRFKLQEEENITHKASLNAIRDSIEKLNSRNKLIQSKIEQFKARNDDLEQRLLKLMINYEIRRKIGVPLQENEKYLLNILDGFKIELNSPINKEIRRQKLNEFVEVIKSYELINANRIFQQSNQLKQSTTSNLFSTNDPILGDTNALNEIQRTLREEHKAFKSLIDVINKDMKCLNAIKKDLFNEK